MPLYDFRCPCGHTFEALVPASRDTHPCPRPGTDGDGRTAACGQAAVRQVSGARTTFRFADTKPAGAR